MLVTDAWLLVAAMILRLLTIGFDAEGRETWALTPMGTPVANQMAMGHEDHAAALLDAGQADTADR